MEEFSRKLRFLPVLCEWDGKINGGLQVVGIQPFCVGNSFKRCTDAENGLFSEQIAHL